MKFVVSTGNFNWEDTIGINRARIYRKVYPLADVVTGDGTRVRQLYLDATGTTESSRLHWPQSQPTKRDKALFVSALRMITSLNGTLPQQLGAWMSKSHREHDVRFAPEENAICCQQYNQWGRYDAGGQTKTRAGVTYTRSQMVRQLPMGTERATIRPVAPGRIICEGSAPISYTRLPKPRTLQEIFNEWEETWVWENIRIDGDGRWLAEAMRNGTAIMVSDGSFKPQSNHRCGTAAWIIECTHTGLRACGILRTTTTSASAYRSKLTGIYMMIALIRAVSKVFRPGKDRQCQTQVQ